VRLVKNVANPLLSLFIGFTQYTVYIHTHELSMCAHTLLVTHVYIYIFIRWI